MTSVALSSHHPSPPFFKQFDHEQFEKQRPDERFLPYQTANTDSSSRNLPYGRCMVYRVARRDGLLGRFLGWKLRLGGWWVAACGSDQFLPPNRQLTVPMGPDERIFFSIRVCYRHNWSLVQRKSTRGLKVPQKFSTCELPFSFFDGNG